MASVVLALGCRSAHPVASADTSASHPALIAPRDAQEALDARAVLFDPPRPPEALVDSLASRRVALLGESHRMREHQEFLLAVANALRDRGARLLLLEGFQADSWWVNAFVTGASDDAPPVAEMLFGLLLRGLRTSNAARPPAERLEVALIDIDHRAVALPASLSRVLRDQAPGDAPCVRAFLGNVGWDASAAPAVAGASFEQARRTDPGAYAQKLGVLRDALREGRCATGTRVSKDELVEMVEVAQESLRIRGVWDTQSEDAAHPLREEVIKAIADRRIAAVPTPVLINIGGYHGQRSHVMGTPKKWLAEHLAEPSSSSRGSFVSVYVTFARAEQERNGARAWFDASPPAAPGELFARLSTRARGRATYLPLDAPPFREPMPINYMGRLVTHAPAATFDAFVLLPEGHLLP